LNKILVNHRRTPEEGLGTTINHLVLGIANGGTRDGTDRATDRRAFQRTTALISDDGAG
jgi:hypothetical protein